MPDRVFPRGRGALLFLILSADALLLPSGLWLDALAAGVLALLIAMGWFVLARKYRFADGFALLDRLLVKLPEGATPVLHSDSKNVASRFCGNRNGAVSCSRDRVAAS